ncbi:MAG: MBL fold metallo-hydrolase [Syntrophales bacterium]|nr:MBL fold metallo-hydrolase [Syntrophales bacterium]
MIRESKGEIVPGLYAIGIPDLPAYLIVGKEPTLFDGGITFMGPTYINDLRKLLGDERRLLYNILTHSHFDHAGTTPFLKRKIPRMKVAAHSLVASTLRKKSAVDLIRSLSSEFEVKYRDFIGDENVSFSEVDVDITLEDGMTIYLGGGVEILVIATPGHTRDSMSYYILPFKALVTGEAIGVFDKNYSIQPEFLTSYKNYLASLERLAQLDLEIIMMSHYFVLTGEDAREYIPRSIEATKRFRDRIERALKANGGNQEAVVRKIYEEDFIGTGAVMQEERPYLLNLQAKVRCIAEGL